jgi:hypothetical protein
MTSPCRTCVTNWRNVRLAKARNAIDQLDSDLVKAGNTPPDDSGVHVAIAQHHLESVAALLRASEARGWPHNN